MRRSRPAAGMIKARCRGCGLLESRAVAPSATASLQRRVLIMYYRQLCPICIQADEDNALLLLPASACLCLRAHVCCVWALRARTATMAAVGKVTETIQEVMDESDGSYTADDKWDVVIEGPSSANLEVSCAKLLRQCSLAARLAHGALWQAVAQPCAVCLSAAPASAHGAHGADRLRTFVQRALGHTRVH